MAHENSVSFEQDGKNILIPSVVNGKQLTDDEALAQQYNPNKLTGIAKTEAKKLGLSTIFDKDVITLSKSDIPIDTTVKEFSTLLHELRHRGLDQIKESGIEIEAFFAEIDPNLLQDSFEPVVRLLGIVSGTETQEENKATLKKEYNIELSILKNPRFLVALMAVQRAASDLIQEERPSQLNLPSMDSLLEQLDEFN